MKINHIAQTFGVEIQKAAGNQKSISKNENAKKGDSVSFSEKGKNLNTESSSVETATNRIHALSEVRWEKVNEVKEKLANGFYNTESFKEALADRLIKDFGL